MRQKMFVYRLVIDHLLIDHCQEQVTYQLLVTLKNSHFHTF